MKPEEQTPQVKEHLYKLTLQFVRKYQPLYYKQFRGDQEDLASEFFCQFLTAKARERGKEETLLDKYNPKITSLEYLTKVAVIRMLIDRSRQDHCQWTSIDNFIDEYGDVVIKTFGLSTEDEEISVDQIEFTPDFIEDAKLRFSKMSVAAQEAFRKQYYEVRNVIAKQFVMLFDAVCPLVEVVEAKQLELKFGVVMGDIVRECWCQQITPKTVCLLVDDDVYNFDRLSGAGRGKEYRDWHLTVDALAEVKEYDVYKSGYSREEFVHKYILA